MFIFDGEIRRASFRVLLDCTLASLGNHKLIIIYRSGGEH